MSELAILSPGGYSSHQLILFIGAQYRETFYWCLFLFCYLYWEYNCLSVLLLVICKQKYFGRDNQILLSDQIVHTWSLKEENFWISRPHRCSDIAWVVIECFGSNHRERDHTFSCVHIEHVEMKFPFAQDLHVLKGVCGRSHNIVCLTKNTY